MSVLSEVLRMSNACWLDGELHGNGFPSIRAWEIEVGDRAWRIARSTMYPAEVTYQHLLAQFELAGHDIPDHLRRHGPPKVTRLPTVMPRKQGPRVPRLEDTFSL